MKTPQIAETEPSWGVWLLTQIEKRGGAEAVARTEAVDKRRVGMWVMGCDLHLDAQGAITRISGASLAEVRRRAGLVSTPFSLFLAQEILPHGSVVAWRTAAQCKASRTSVQQWIGGEHTPRGVDELARCCLRARGVEPSQKNIRELKAEILALLAQNAAKIA